MCGTYLTNIETQLGVFVEGADCVDPASCEVLMVASDLDFGSQEGHLCLDCLHCWVEVGSI